MKPRIALASYIYNDSPLPATYFAAVERFGGYPLAMGVTTEQELPFLLESADALLLTGGGDVDSRYFRQPPHEKSTPCSKERDETELLLAAAFVRAGKPVLGICRGVQVLNVALGGDLCQHVFDLPSVQIQHQDKDTRHRVRLVPESLLSSIFGHVPELTVNSTHHQAVQRPGDGLTISALSTDGVIEAVEMGDRVLGVQWHPERMLEEGMEPIFRWFLGLAQGGRR